MLDMGGLSVYVYNKELEAERKVWLGFPALDFVRVSDGFLCYNLAVSDTLRQVVYVNDSGKIVDSFGASEVSNSGFTGSKLFSKSGEDDVYCVLPFRGVRFTVGMQPHTFCLLMCLMIMGMPIIRGCNTGRCRRGIGCHAL